MSSCEEDDFGLLRENSGHSEQHQRHRLPASASYTTQHFAAQLHQQPKGPIPGIAHQQLHHLSHSGVLHHQQPSSSLNTHRRSEEEGHSGPALTRRGERQEEENDENEEDPAAVQEEGYEGAFVHSQPPQPRAAVAIALQDAKTCFDRTTPSNPAFEASTQQVVSSPASSPKHEDDDHHHCDPALAVAAGDNHTQEPMDSNCSEEFKTKGRCIVPPAAVEATGILNKRRDRDELSEDGASTYYLVATSVPPPTSVAGPASGSTKKARASSSSVCAIAAPANAIVSSPAVGGVGGGDYRKDREEWSDSAIACLLDAYTDKYIQLNRGNLRGRDWEDVAAIVSQRSDQQQQNKFSKTVEQCKNKVDNLKKRYKAERQRITSGALSTSHWPWFKKLEVIVGTSSSPSAFPKSMSLEEEKPAVSSSAATTVAPASSIVSGSGIKQGKRFTGAQLGSAQGILVTNLKMKALSNPRWKRVVLRISGTVFSNNGQESVDPKVTMLIAREIAMANRLGVELAVVVGGRNIFCGETWVSATAIDRTAAYQISMMATVMNSVLLQASLEKIGLQARVQTGFMMQEVAEPYIRRRAIRHLEKGRIVIFGGIGAGLAHPFFTTDTAAALRASEINADAILKGHNMDVGCDCTSNGGKSPLTSEHISFKDSASRGYIGMDMTAISFCEENRIPVLIFNLLEPGHLSRALCGDQVGILIDQAGAIS